MDTKTLRKSKVEFYFTDKEEKVPVSFFKQLLEENLDIDEKWFVRGCLHTAERHYTEAIKRFQLSKTDDARLLLLACCFKVADRFLFDEFYKEELKEFKYLPKYKIKPYWVFEDKKKPIDEEFIKQIKELF